MVNNIFVNLMVADLARSMEFFKGLGFGFNPKFTNDQAACLVLSDTIFAMLITPDRFADFTPKTVIDAHQSTEVLTALGLPSREAVDEIVDTALLSGASILRPPEEYGFMYARSFSDPDGHVWEFFWMDPAAEVPDSTN